MSGPILEVRDVRKRFGGLEALAGPSFDVPEGAIVGLIGPNGSGKSTLFDCITGTQRLDGGEVRFAGRRISGLAPYQIARRGVGRTFQLGRLFGRLSVLENLLAVRGPLEGRRAEARAHELIELVGLTRVTHELAANLSYGQSKLLEFIRALMLDPILVLLDEPAAGVNPTLLERIVGYVRGLRDRGVTVLVVEHNMGFIMGLCDQVVVLDHGEKIAEGPPQEIREDERVIEAYFGR
ncbi:MAG TPA: ABC transporter ATP-binding protein [Thermodesulfobacteriota bacterium]